MSNKSMFFLLLAVICALVAGCAQQDGGDGSEATPTATEHQTSTPGTTTNGEGSIYSYYEGFMEPEKGMWVEWKNNFNGEQTVTKYVFAGKETIDGEEAMGYEYNYQMENQEVTVQTWTSTSGSAVKSVVKYQDQVLCHSISDTSNLPSTQTPDNYEPGELSEKPDWSHGVFTTESGKTVDVIKFTESRNGINYEVWVSSEVPFGVVKTVKDGKTVMELKDFGMDTDLKISLQEVKNCQEMTIPTGMP